VPRDKVDLAAEQVGQLVGEARRSITGDGARRVGCALQARGHWFEPSYAPPTRENSLHRVRLENRADWDVVSLWQDG
jgi:hypothetical protein